MITINNSLSSEMIADFELERGEMIKIRDSSKQGSFEYKRAVNRLAVIDQSVDELKKQINDPTRMQKQAKGGYSKKELERFYTSQLPSESNTEYSFGQQ
jgi:hypothetical protein